MRRGWSWRALEVAVFIAALAASALLARVGYLAATHRDVPVWAWVFIASIAAVGLPFIALQGGWRGANDGAIRHSSGELVIVRGYRERRRRGTRIALDWKYGLRGYPFVPSALLVALFAGFGLLGTGVWWQVIAGALVVVGVVVATGALIRWLLLPVDPDSKAKLDEYYEWMRWDWGALGGRVRSVRNRYRAR